MELIADSACAPRMNDREGIQSFAWPQSMPGVPALIHERGGGTFQALRKTKEEVASF